MQSNNPNSSAASNQAQQPPVIFSTQGSQHMTHLSNPSNPGEPYDKCAIQFNLPNAIIWQIKFILSGVTSKKSLAGASSEFNTLSEGYGKDFDKYLLKELMEQIDINDASKASKDKNESVKITLFNLELLRASNKPEFLSYFSEIMQSTYGLESSKSKPTEFLQEITKRLKLNAQLQILVTLSMLESTQKDSVFDEILKVFRQKLIEYHANGKPEQLPEYAVHRILFLFDTVPDLGQDPVLREAKQLIVETSASRFSQFTPLRASLIQDISQVNSHPEMASYNFLRDGGGFEHLEFVHKVIQPWEVLNDIGHTSSYMYDFLLKTLSEFKQIDEKIMALTILQLAINHQGKDDLNSKIVLNALESNKDGNSNSIKKEPEDKKTLMSWSIDNLARAFRELYSTLNWNKVFESFGEIEDTEIPQDVLENGLDSKQFQTLLQLFNKSKPQNFLFPLQSLLSQKWKSASLQLTFIKNCIFQFVSKKEKNIQFNKLKNKTATIQDLLEIKDRGEPAETIEVWQSVDLVERLLILAESKGLFVKVRKVFEHPTKQLPEYLLLSLSKARTSNGNIMIDELLSILMPLFLGNHANSSLVLQRLCELNKSMFIRGICELCKHDQRLMNLSRVLDITQEVKDSLIPIVYCEDYNFAVNLGILAGKRDFLHYDVWIKSRIKDVGSPFVDALLKYIYEHIISPVGDFVKRNQQLADTNPENFETQKTAILERSHLSKDKLMLTIDHLQNPALRQNEKIQRDTLDKISELASMNQELFPQHYEPGQNSEEIDAAANEHFQRVFSADESEVDVRIEELIQTMQNFKESPEVKEQEIYACMLHGLFDEYRFLHRYPQNYLIKIAKLFGAIIKNNLLDRVLQDIALKFVIEAFRRDGRRQKFGIIVIQSFFDMLPQFPKFLEDIYQIRQSIQSSEPRMMADIERLYQEMIQNNQQQVSGSEIGTEAVTHDSSDDNNNFAAQIIDQNLGEGLSLSDDNQSSILSVNSGRKSQQIDNMLQKGEKMFANQVDLKLQGNNQKESNKKNAQNQRNSAQQQNQLNQGKQNQKNQRQTNMQMQTQQQNIGGNQMQNQQILKSMTPPMIGQTKEFIPTNRVPQVQQTFNQQNQINTGNAGQSISQAKVFIPTIPNGILTGQKTQNQPNQMQQPSALVDHMNNTIFNSSGPMQQKTMFKQFMGNQVDNSKNVQPQQQPANSNNTQNSNLSGGTSLNIRSAEFQRPMSTSNITPGTGQQERQININSKEFMPSKPTPEIMQPPQSRNEIKPQQIQELLDYQKVIVEKIRNAKETGGKVRLEELLDDSSIKVESEYVEDQIRIICNNTGRGNFERKIEDLKKFVIKNPAQYDEEGKEVADETSAKADDHLRWFIHYILTKRLGAQSLALQNIYVEMIRELNSARLKVTTTQSVVGLTLSQSALIFKKCMLIDEEEFQAVTNVAQGGGAVIKGYLQSLGSFVGTLTVAKDEPIRSLHLDLKQILIEGFQAKNRRLAVTFVCRILKETQHSRVFSLRNPWVNNLMSILREVYDLSQLIMQSRQTNNDHLMEIDSLFKTLNAQNSSDIKSFGILQSLVNPLGLLEQVVRNELDYMFKKNKMIMPSQPAPAPIVTAQEEAQQRAQTQGGAVQNQFSDSDMMYQMSQISQRVSVSNDLIQIFQKYPKFDEQKIRRLVGNAVDNSIVEILPPVVDRSVTIAKITTKELVLKDFAYDGNYRRVLEAADLIVQNLAGSLALVTCREPLRMSLTTNLKKIFDQYFKSDLGLDILSGSNQNRPQGEQNESNQNTQNNQQSSYDITEAEKVDSNGFLSQVTEEQINEIAQIASKENLELGCKLIKKEVIEKALKKVREDHEIMQAVERRMRAEEQGIRPFRDETIVAKFQDLPPQLQPNPNGLTPAQFQVYEDFSKLRQHIREGNTGQPAGSSASGAQDESGMTSPQASSILMHQQQPQNLTSILKMIDQYGLTDMNKGYLLNKINQMNQAKNQLPSEEEREKLWTYVRRNLETACKNYDSRNPQGVEPIIQVLSLIVTSYKIENFSKKLLTNVFLQLDVRIFNEVELNILLMSKGIISISEWDSQLAIFFKDSAAQLPESELQFFANFLKTSIVEKKILTKEEVPQLISVIEKMSLDQKIGNFCKYILETLSFKNNMSSPPLGDANYANLREFFIKWVVMSYVDDKEHQEKQINTLYKDLRGMGIDQEPKLLFSFCKVMVQTSIEKALVFGDDSGEKRPADRLDFRYIDSFVRLIVVLLKMFSFNKHEFMTKVLEFIGECLDDEHRTKKAEFNQRPYYRMLMNILTAVNHRDCFNQKTQLLILFSMADLFKNLSPSLYPAFCFSWLELVSHKQFLPHFLKSQQNILGSTTMGTGQQNSQFINIPSLQNSSGLQGIGTDTTFHERRFKIAELIVNLFSFLKSNMVPGQVVPPAIQAFYHATLRVISVIKHDFPDFLSDFHFNFVNSLPDHCIQLKNLILSAYPQNIQQPDPFKKDLKIDLLTEIKQNPRILSNYENYLSLMNLREDLDNYTRTRNPQLIQDICHKMEQSEEIVNGRRRINSNVISAVVLFIADQACQQQPGIEKHRESRETFKQIVQRLNDETRLCCLNAIINELRFPNNHTFYFLCIILFIHAEAGREIIFEQISSIFLERLQTNGPYPWGLMISFRELIQNPKYAFMRKQYIREHPQSIAKLFQGQLRNFLDFIPVNQRTQLMQGQLNTMASEATVSTTSTQRVA